MAPLAMGAVPAWPWDSAVGNESVISTRPSKHQQVILQIVALTSAGTSFLAALMTTYWFVKMRRSFRHNLILFMIVSDSIKAICYIVFPIVQFVEEIVPAPSAFCQTSGFFLSLGIEGTDFAVLVIAIHTALCVFRSGRSSRESGLYRYRYIVYTLWIAIPIVLASLAFANTGLAYMPQGTSCYLPVRPLWFRLALSWIPRYLVFFAIFVIYFAIFIWVKYHFNRLNFQTNDTYVGQNTGGTTFADEQGSRPDSRQRANVRLGSRGSTIEMLNRQENEVLPATPRLNRHGHIPSDGSSRSDLRSRKAPPVASALRGSIQINDSPSPQSSSHDRNCADYMSDPFISELMAEREKEKLAVPDLIHHKSLDRDSGIGSMSENSSPYDDSSVVGILDALRDPQAQPLAKPRRGLSSEPRLSNSFITDNLATRQIRRRQKAINRQLRLVFVYPVTYCLVWFIPFVNHCLQFSDNYLAHPPFAFLCCAGFSLAFQTAVYCLLFSTREKPWKHIPGSDGSFFGSFMFWNHVSAGEVSRWHPRQRHISHANAGGRRKPDAVEETRLAYQRRGVEKAAAVDRMKVQLNANGGVKKTGGKNWWDVEENTSRVTHSPDSPDSPAPVTDNRLQRLTNVE
ncbi:MAG: hypothetical protein M1812_000707 [Candelaria pacifica]|nr:MAG: hypothetical protein M1812_000707 [Candelaria pacifica]